MNEKWELVSNEDQNLIYGGAFDVGGLIGDLIGLVQFGIIGIPTAKKIWESDNGKVTLPGGFSAEWNTAGPKEVTNNFSSTPGYYVV